MNIAYVLVSFPEPSQTFISEEALSAQQLGQNISILYANQGSASVVHDSARALIETKQPFKISQTKIAEKIEALAYLFTKNPARTIRTLVSALQHRSRGYFRTLPAAAWCKKQNIQFLHAHFADTNFVNAAAISEWTGIPYGVTTHRYDIFDDPLSVPDASRLFKNAGAVVTISEFNQNLMVEKYALSREAIHLVHCGIDLNQFAYSPPQSTPKAKIQILNVGRLVPMKAQDILIRALKIAKDLGVDFQLNIVGDGPLLNDLQALANSLGLADNITFCGAQPGNVVRDEFNNADLFVLSSRSEGLPVACIESMAMGVPVIATRIFGIPELIEHKVSGLLVPPDDPQALAEAIHWAYTHTESLVEMTQQGRKVVETSFERTDCSKQLISHWQKAIQRT